ncbi:MAG: phosphoenolpyruvate--protein phosphotransferase [Taibaiella sp.]|jgi:phosphotransferase system enzyme I (PtsP)
MLKIMQRIIQDVNAAQSAQEALHIVVTRVCEAINVEACSIFVLDPTSQRYVLIASQGFKPGVDGVISLGLDQGLVGLVGQREEPINLKDATKHSHYHYIPRTGEEKYKAFLGVPIIHQRRVLGVLVAQQTAERAFGADEEAFLVTISTQLSDLIAHAQSAGVLSRSKTQSDKRIIGIPGVSGVALGTAVIAYPLAALDAVPDRKAQDINIEIEIFNKALVRTREEIKMLSERLAHHLPLEEQDLFDAYLRILDNESLGFEVNEVIKKGHWAQGALKQVIALHSRLYEEMDDAYLRERGADLRDIGRRVLSYLQADAREKIIYPEKAVLMGDEITPARLAEAPRERIVAIVTAKGSINSHVVIIARAMGIPTIIGAEGLLLSDVENKKVIVDAYHGVVYIDPSKILLEEFTRLEAEEKELSHSLEKLHDVPAQTPDGYRIPLYVNTGLVGDIQASLSVGAEGVGLYRTEVPFMVRDRFPSEEEQRVIYRQLLEAFTPRPVTMRTLDIGGDKILPYFPIEEANPFLGWRGIRITLDHPEIFLVQVRAMIHASKGCNNLQIMLPMITSLYEVLDAKALIMRAYEELREEGHDVVIPKIGAMIEVPSAVYQAELISKEVDFLSIGSNDLIQYILAVDRNNSRVANLYEGLHPAIINALLHVVNAAHAQNKTVSLCGEMAGDPTSVILLLAMGFDSLSMSSASLPRIKWVIRNFSLSRAQELLQDVLTMHHSKEIRTYLENALEESGLGGLIRAGK